MSDSKFILGFEKPLRTLEEQLNNLKKISEDNQVDLSSEITAIDEKINKTKVNLYKGLNAWEKVQLARHPKRPYSLDYIGTIFEEFQELHGDRSYRDDPAIVGGTAFLDGQPVMIIAQQKGRNTKENIKRNFGCPNPEGYRKALRLMRMAAKFKLPIITLIDTPGAYPGVGSEERHVAEAIAVNIREMSQFEVPIISVVIGEGGSGGALGIAVADKVMIFENAYYSVISPEGCAAILWKDRAFAPQAADALSLTSDKLFKLGVVDEIIIEPLGGAHNSLSKSAESLKAALQKHLKVLTAIKPDKLLEGRYQKYRVMGEFNEPVTAEHECS